MGFFCVAVTAADVWSVGLAARIDFATAKPPASCDAPLSSKANEITGGMEFTRSLTDIPIPTGSNTGPGLWKSSSVEWITCGWKLLVSITHNSPLPLWFTCVQPFFLSPFSLGFLYLPPSLQGRTLETEICHCSATRFPFIILFSLYFFPVQWSVRQTTSNTATLFQTWPRKYITAQFLWLHQKRNKETNLNIAGGFISETLLVFPEQQHIEVRRKCTESAALKLSSVFISLGQFREDQ